MIVRLIRDIVASFFDLTLPARPPMRGSTMKVAQADLVIVDGKVVKDREPGDGRIFAWVKVKDYAGMNPAYPCILHDIGVGAKLEYVGDVHLMKPSEYGLTLTELALIYPAIAEKE